MSEPFIGEIKIFAGNFAIRNWAFCSGQLLQIAQNTALFAVLGTIYGGDGRDTFALPNLQGRAAMHPGNGSGLTNRRVGETGGTETETPTEQQMPNHGHTMRAVSAQADKDVPAADTSYAATPGMAARGVSHYAAANDSLVQMNDAVLDPNGAGQAHENMQPFLTLNFIIALNGVFPTRN